MINNRDQAILKEFGENLREARISKGLSQEKLALLAEVSKNQIGNIERGEVNITLISLMSISKALRISPKDLFSK